MGGRFIMIFKAGMAQDMLFCAQHQQEQELSQAPDAFGF